MLRALLLAAAALALACNTPRARPLQHGQVTITILGTNDLHGHIEALPLLGGYVRAIREARAADGGGVLLLDGGDMFQGTIASNLGEGAAVVEGYQALGYDAVTVGNHEFDFGPDGPRTVPESAADDPRGALRARARGAAYPFLMANVVEAPGGATPAWENVSPTAITQVAGVRVGLIGVTTESTPVTTMHANFRGLAVTPLADAVKARAAELRAAGAQVIVVLAHAGGDCPGDGGGDPHDLTGCDQQEEAFVLARALSPGTVHAIVAGHTHAPVAKIVNGIPVSEAWSYGRGFGRIDLDVDRAAGAVVGARVHAPFAMCEGKDAPCRPRPYEGRPIQEDPEIARVIAPHLERAQARREEELGVVLAATIERSHRSESALGNLFTDLMIATVQDADLAITNGGGLRADLPAGPLTYGALFEASPFDNRFAVATQTGADVARLYAEMLARDNAFLSLSGLRVTARCVRGTLEVALARPDGRPVAPTDRLKLVTNEFLAGGGDGKFGGVPFEVLDLNIREEMAARLRERGGTLDPDALTRPRRVAFPGKRPVTCP